MEKREKLHEGKAKVVFATDDPNVIIHFFKDSATAFDGKKTGEIEGKGWMNAQISAVLFQLLEEAGVETHFKALQGENELISDKLDMVDLEVVGRNVAAGSLAKRLGYEEGTPLKEAIVEFYYKDDSLGDPIVNGDHIAELGAATPEEVAELRDIALKVNDVLTGFFDPLGLVLIDFKLEFGRKDGKLILADEISPDTCRLWDKETGERLDKDRFRRDMGRVEEAYKEILSRVKGAAV
ncbi:MAG: phosphoribosylaminoimidazolesuccinocarboxamide synthase [Candidatus Aquicultorales bacterium]